MRELNTEQAEAVRYTEGPLLLLAGAGSGKTRVLTHRIAYLIEEKGVAPYNILAITFTNKAAGEMRERVDRIVSYGADSVWVSTFHALCVRILRRYIDQLDYQSNFTIYDSDDQKAVVKNCLKKLNMDSKQYPERGIMAEISRAKERFISTSEYDREASGDYRKMQTARVYAEYQAQLKANNALDFDDLLYKTVELFQFHPEILDSYQERFRYIMVDEYQDTNHIQFLLIKQLAAKYRNLCVVGDDDQSIYKFRGANIYNILNFEEEYSEAKVIKLEQNYRSTGNILGAANGVISHNVGRKEKALWTEAEEGEKVSFCLYDTEYQEAEYTVSEIINQHRREGRPYNQFAILYRTNAQSRIYEEKLLMRNIPYKIIGGQNFYGRREVKDLICYLKVIDNGRDDMAVRRIVNVPKRGIGMSSVEKVQAYADTYEMGLFDAMFEAANIPGLNRAVAKIEAFSNLIMDFRDMVEEGAFLSEVYDAVLEKTGYWNELAAEGTEEAEARMENLTELKNKIVKYEEEAEQPSLSELLEEIALVADVDNVVESEEKVLLMTLHSAKGLEFPCIFLGGMEDRLFPSSMALNSEDEDAEEEERRLCYVGITRAKERLFLSAARQRMMHGSTNYNPISRFIKEIPEEVISMNGEGAYTLNRQKETSRQAFEELARQGRSVSSKPYSYSAEASSRVPSFGKEFKVERMEVDYTVGDTVRHVRFGTGVVLELKSGGKDYEVTVDFEKVGVKRMFASFAKLKKLE
ncbi:MAG: UvrD-helicase domain-containing protein [Bacteroidales bacterium]|nr:UvrD-helicase domain-containing protein [Clostridium sp.]MCM1202989.1 UvrD-helicase domain-containing protein [Bacteroidales bacterium]